MPSDVSSGNVIVVSLPTAVAPYGRLWINGLYIDYLFHATVSRCVKTVFVFSSSRARKRDVEMNDEEGAHVSRQNISNPCFQARY